MAKPLFEPKEIEQNKIKYAQVEKKLKDGVPWNEYWAEKEAIDRAIQIEISRRVHNRSEEYLNALLVLVGTKGARYTDFRAAFSDSDQLPDRKYLVDSNTPESRRDLHTILKALTQIPKSWARSAFVRFLRGTGKQKGAKYHGAGSFGPQYGWTEREVTAVCEIIAGDTNPYAKVLMSYADTQKEVQEADPDFEVIEADVQFKATRVERDVDFISKLLKILEERGLADVSEPKERKEKKLHVPKIFKPGDVIRKNTIRDLPLPAHVKIPIERLDGKPESVKLEKGTSDFLERVVLALGGSGNYIYAAVNPGQNIAYKAQRFSDTDYKRHLEGATYAGPWKGRIEKGKELKINFRYRFIGGG